MTFMMRGIKEGKMPEGKPLLLSIDEALDALRMAFVQYPVQLNLLSNIWPLVFGQDAYVQQDARRPSVWAKIPGKDKLIRTNAHDLKARILAQLRRSPPAPDDLARICAMVFGTRVQAEKGAAAGSFMGIHFHTDMADFVCRRCGHCCRKLEYRDGCTVADYRRWQELGRDDILRWVGTVRKDGRVVACRIWMVPGTNRFAETCPWLKRSADQDRFACTIHDERPTICRQYPGSRKHARMTGCRGV